jgi:hypothetical protein
LVIGHDERKEGKQINGRVTGKKDEGTGKKETKEGVNLE